MSHHNHTAKIFCPATVGNVGPGFDVLGLCLADLGDEITIRLIDSKESVIEDIKGLDQDLIPKDPAKNCTVIAAEHMLNSLSIQKKVAVSFDRSLPISGGLGSSAAASVGGAYGALLAAAAPKNILAIMQSALAGERFVAGNHLDNIAPCTLGGLTIVVDNDQAIVKKLELQNDLWFFATVSPQVKIDTKAARTVLSPQSSQAEWTGYSAMTAATVAALTTGDFQLLSQCFVDRYAEPKRKCLIPHFDEAKEQSLKNGALAFGISGAGPTLFMIAKSSKEATQAAEAVGKVYTDAIIHVSPINNKGATPL